MNTLLVLSGATGVGKTEYSVKIAQKMRCPILSADSRQIYNRLNIGVAAPDKDQLARVQHYFICTLPLDAYYSASQYEEDVLALLNKLFVEHDTVIMTGGSMLYVDAVCNGIDEIPNIDKDLRAELAELYRREGLDPIRRQLKMLDPIFYDQVDLKNPKRVIHALEICLMSGKPYSSLRTNSKKERPFRIKKVGFMRTREELYNRINERVDKMVEAGLVEEARALYPMRHLNSLNTVGYKELFDFFDGNCTLDFAIDKIKQHTRNYARKQITWFGKDDEISWINLSDPLVDVEAKVEALLKHDDKRSAAENLTVK